MWRYERDAAKLVCPIMDRPSENAPVTMCIGSKCMAWEGNLSEDTGRCRLLKNPVPMHLQGVR